MRSKPSAGFQDADADEYQDKLKELEDVTNPIMAKLYAAGGGVDDDHRDHDEF